MGKVIVTNGGNSKHLAQRIAKRLRAKYSPLTISSFPDRDLYLRFNINLKDKTLILVQSFQPHPDMSLFDVLFAAETAKDLGARRVILVAPYLAYLRQDKRFREGECVSSQVMAKLLNSAVDGIIIVDPHLHRYHSLEEIFNVPARKVTANPLIAEYIKKNYQNEIIIGPDSESYQWAEEIAQHLNVQATVMCKQRFGSRKVKVKMVKPVSLKNKDVIIVDDIVSTGHTVMEAAEQARKKGAKTISLICVHGLFVEGAVDKLAEAGVTKIVSTNTVEHPTNQIDVTYLLAEELSKIL